MRPRLRHCLSFTLATLLSGCTLGNTPLADQPQAPRTLRDATSQQIYNLLVAELAARQGDWATAASHYEAAAQKSSDPKVAERAMQLALAAKDSKLSSQTLERWIRLAPDSPEAAQYRAMEHVQAGRYDEAVNDLIKLRDHISRDKAKGDGTDFIITLLALSKDKEKVYQTLQRYAAKDNSNRTQLALAAFAIKAKRPEEGLTAARQVQKRGNKSEKVQATRLISEALRELDKPAEALAELKAAYQADPQGELALDYARALILADRRTEAQPLFQRLHANAPNNPDLIYTLGLLYLEQKDHTKAEPLLKQLQDDPKYGGEAHYFLGQTYEGLNRPQEAITAYQRVEGSQTAAATQRALELLTKTANPEKAREWLQQQRQAASSDTRKLQLYRAEAQWLHDRHDYAAALDVLNQALALRPDHPELLYARALSAEKAGNVAAAESDLRTLLTKQPDNPTFLNALGYMLATHTDRLGEAEPLIRQALEKEPDDPAIWDSLGWVLHRSGKSTEAEQWLRKAQAQLPDPEIAGHLIEVLVTNGKRAEAEQLLNDLLAKHPQDPHLQRAKQKLQSP